MESSNKPNTQRPASRRGRLVWQVLLTLLVLWVFWHTYTVWFAAFLAVCFTATLSGLAHWLRRWLPWGYGVCLTVVVISLAVLFGAMALGVGPALVEQSSELTQRLPEAVDQGEKWLEQQKPWGPYVLQLPQKWSDTMAGGQVMGRLTGIVSSTLAAGAGILAVLAIALFLAVDPKTYLHGFMMAVPPQHEKKACEVVTRIATALRWWMFGRVTSMLIVGIFTGLGLWLVGVPLAWSLGLIAGLLSFVPNLGPIIALIPGLLLASTEGGRTLVYALGVYVGVQLVESNVITPMVQRYAVSVPPALLLTLQLAMGVLFGVMGLLVATPLMVAGIVAIQMLYVEGKLGRDVTVMGQHDKDD